MLVYFVVLLISCNITLKEGNTTGSYFVYCVRLVIFISDYICASMCLYTIIVQTAGSNVSMCPRVLVATSGNVHYRMNVYCSVMCIFASTHTLYRYNCICAPVCVILYHCVILLIILQEMVSVWSWFDIMFWFLWWFMLITDLSLSLCLCVYITCCTAIVFATVMWWQFNLRWWQIVKCTNVNMSVWLTILCPIGNKDYLVSSHDPVVVIVSCFSASLLFSHVLFILLSFCLTNTVFSKFKLLGGCIMCGMLLQFVVKW